MTALILLGTAYVEGLLLMLHLARREALIRRLGGRP